MKLFVTIYLLLLSMHLFANSDYPFQERLEGNHLISILEDGPESLLARLNLIRSATKTIDVEYFIFKPDTAGKLLFNELLKKAKEGVKVRILIDKSPLAKPISDDVANISKPFGIEIRYFNPIGFLTLAKGFSRSHRKFIIVDQERLITGGRNIGLEYYNYLKGFSFLDRDIYLEGPIAKTISESFDHYWGNKMTKGPKKKKYHLPKGKDLSSLTDEEISSLLKKKKLRLKRVQRAIKFMQNDSKTNDLEEKVYRDGTLGLESYPTFTCSNIEFISDRPGTGNENRTFTKYFYPMLKRTQSSITFETPYFITLKTDRRIIKALLNDGKKVELITNSTHSNNHPMVSNVTNRRIKKWVKAGMQAFFMSGLRPSSFFEREADDHNDSGKKIWGLHSKSILQDESLSGFLTFNMDPQSQLRSAEMGIFCHQGNELANHLRELMELHKEKAFKIGKNGKPENGKGLLQNTNFWEKLSYFFRIIPSLLFAGLL